jgi:cardiolipin synthase
MMRVLAHRSRWLVRLVWAGATVVALLQAGVVTALWAIAAGRRRREQAQGFPHATLPPVRINENALQIYSYGRDLYDAMLAAMDAAEESIYLETFIWKDDAVGQAFKELLIRKAQADVAVRVIFDGFGNMIVPHAFKVFPPSVHAIEYQAIRRPWQVLDPRRYALDHRKLLIVDGRVGFIGGYNLGDLYATEWRDTHLRVDGPAAAQLAQQFVDFWNEHCPAERRIKRHYPRQFDPRIVVRDTNALRLSFPIRDMYIAAIDRAEQHVLITNAYFIPDGTLLHALVSAAERGVRVEVLLPYHSNHPVADWLARGYFSRCLRAGIHLFGYRAMIHAKTCTIDGEWSTIGTANLDRLSAVGNYEINVEIYSRPLARQMEALFAQDKTNATEILLERWDARPGWSRLGETILTPLRHVL